MSDDGAGLHVAHVRVDPRELPPPEQPMAVARQFIEERFQRGDHVILRRWRGGWWSWHTSHWVETDDARVRGWAYRYTENAEYTDDSGKVPKTVSWSPTRYKIMNLLEALQAIVHLPDDVHPPQWIASTIAARATEFVSVQNGLLHVPTRTLHPHDAGLFNVVSVPFAYEPGAACPRWEQFLDTLWPDDDDSIAALQEFFGYVISGRIDLHKILLLVGPTRAGKGVIARILKAMIGAGNCAGPTLASLGQNFGLSPLIGKPLAIISDARLGNGGNTHQVVERLLSVSGEDMLTIDRKYRVAWTGTLPTRFLVISNELPNFGDASGAIANRFVILSLAESWLGRENPALTDELLPELPGILNWTLKGLGGLTSNGRFTEPASARDAVVALQDLVSPVAAFVRDRCQRGQYEIVCATLYQAWKCWAQDNGHKPGSQQTFGRDLRAVIPALRMISRRKGVDRIRSYAGVRLGAEPSPEPGAEG